MTSSKVINMAAINKLTTLTGTSYDDNILTVPVGNVKSIWFLVARGDYWTFAGDSRYIAIGNLSYNQATLLSICTLLQGNRRL